MNVSRDTCLVVLGAVVGIATVYLTPCTLFKTVAASDESKKENTSDTTSVTVHRSQEKEENNAGTPKVLGCQMITNILDKFKELSQLWDENTWKINFPDEGSSTSIFYDAKSELQNSNVNNHTVLDDIITNMIDSTVYHPLPEGEVPKSMKRTELKRKFSKICKGINASIKFKDKNEFQKCHPKSSTFIDAEIKKTPEVFPEWQTGFEEELKIHVEDSQNSTKHSSNRKVIFRLKNSKSPFRRLCQSIVSFLSTKKGSPHRQEGAYMEMSEEMSRCGLDINNNSSKNAIVV